MKNILLLIMAFLVSGAGCYSPPLPPLPPQLNFILVFEKGSEVAKDILSPKDTINVEEVYFYIMEEGQKKKIKIGNFVYVLEEKFEHLFLISTDESYNSFGPTYDPIFDAIAGKGLTKVYLQKHNNAVDTIEMAVRKEIREIEKNKRVWKYDYYLMDEITINGKTPIPFGGFTSPVGYAYYLEAPKSPASRLPLR